MWLASGCKGELRDDDEFSQFESGRDCLFAESGGVVLVSAADFLNRPWVRRRFNRRDTWPLFSFGRWRRRVLFCNPLMLISPRTMEQRSISSSGSNKLKPR